MKKGWGKRDGLFELQRGVDASRDTKPERFFVVQLL